MEAHRFALKIVLVVGCRLVGAGLLFVFALILTDVVLVVIHAITKSPRIDPLTVPPGIYLAGLFILSIGAGLLVLAVRKSKPPNGARGNQGAAGPAGP